jgi:rSAM/selenodomain-associated transferase 2
MRLAIIIPTLNEEQALRSNLPAAARQADLLVVADGGSTDDSVQVARRQGAEVVEAGRGRGCQLDAGARAAIAGGAEWLVFLHADTILPRDAKALVLGVQAQEAVGGGFAVRFDDPRALFRLGAACVNLRTRLCRIPLGDQAQFVRADVFKRLGGFKDWPILEDLDLGLRLRRQGRVAILRQPVTTAARRFTERGIARTIATNWLIWLLFLAGVCPQRLAKLYPHIR